jgi:hypothetical protein
MIILGWYIAGIVWLLGMWLAWRVNQAIIEIEYRELMESDGGFRLLVHIYSFFTVALWPFVQLVSMQRAFAHSGENEEE